MFACNRKCVYKTLTKGCW